jgi:hypothetical protein
LYPFDEEGTGVASAESTLDSDWSRDRWVAYADRLLDGARAHVSPSGAQVLFPGDVGGYGRPVDGLEGFTRTLLIAGFRIAGERGDGVDDLVAWCVRGITAGVDPANPERWVLLTEHDQAKVEAASIALVLDLTRAWVWDALDDVTRQRVIEYLRPVVGDASYPATNWLWFRVVVQTFLRSVGGPWSADDIAADLALHDRLQREDGWISDGEERSYDHYVGWALHLYPVLWARMQGAADLAGDRVASDVARLDRYLLDARALVGADGSPLIQGRSLIYRFAAAAPFWAGALAEVPSTAPGALRHAANRIVAQFADRGIPGPNDVLTLGWHDEWRALAQSYSGPGSPYWAAKGLLGVAIPADHPVWAAPAEPLPVETGDVLRAIAAPGWIVSGTRADGIVRVVNHGTDHAVEGTPSADSPLYARLGYSTATSPLLDEAAWRDPLEQSVVLVDADDRSTHRSGMRPFDARVDANGVGVVGSIGGIHWFAPEATLHRHGSGLPGVASPAGMLELHSLVRGPWEVRLARVSGADSRAIALRVGGWAVSGSTVSGSITPLRGEATPGVATRSDAGPLGPETVVAYLDYPVADDEWIATLITLSRAPEQRPASLDLVVADDALDATVTWPDGLVTTASISNPAPAPTVERHPDRIR